MYLYLVKYKILFKLFTTFIVGAANTCYTVCLYQSSRPLIPIYEKIDSYRILQLEQRDSIIYSQAQEIDFLLNLGFFISILSLIIFCYILFDHRINTGIEKIINFIKKQYKKWFKL